MVAATTIYMAARYSRREELCVYRDVLRSHGHEVTSRWLDGKHQIDESGAPIGDEGESLIEGDDPAVRGGKQFRAERMRRRFLREDLSDLERAHVLIAFTEPPRSKASRGGRHVELGYALAIQRRILVVGHRENLFCWHDSIDFYNSWAEIIGPDGPRWL